MAMAGTLSTIEIERVKVVQDALVDVEHKSLSTMVKDLEKSAHPQTYLVIKEAMAKTYAHMIKEQEVQGQQKRAWLYSMINLNMAYLQFVGTRHKAAADTPLNMLIRNKLREYLPADIDRQPGFLQSVD